MSAVNSINSVSFKSDSLKTEDSQVKSQTQPQVPPSSPKDSVSFGKKEKEDKKELKYEKTNFFKTFGAVVGGIFGALAAVGLALNPKGSSLNELSKAGRIGTAIGAMIVLPLGGMLGGILPDFVINKTVKNTVKSINDNFELQPKEKE